MLDHELNQLKFFMFNGITQRKPSFRIRLFQIDCPTYEILHIFHIFFFYQLIKRLVRISKLKAGIIIQTMWIIFVQLPHFGKIAFFNGLLERGEFQSITV